MALESCMICVDNSEFMRNSDYAPTRMEAQQDCASYITNIRLQANAESTVGLLSMAGKGVELLVSPTDNNGKLLAALGQVKVGGKVDFIVSIQIAMLALNHRRNTNGGKRIICFVGSPIVAERPKLQQLAAQLKKNNFAIDVVSMGETDANNEILTEFVNAVVNNENSSLLVIRAGSERPIDEIMQSASLGLGRGRPGGSGGFGGGAVGGGDMDFDESQDPELAMVLRISQEEARQAAEAQAARTSGAVAQPVLGEDAGGDYDEDADLAAALALSMQSGGGGSSSAAVHVPAQNHADVGDDAGEDEDDAEMAAALALSMQGSQTLPPQPPASTAAGDAGVDADFVRQMLGQLGDVDPNDPLIAAALAQLGAGPTDSSKADKKRKEPDSK